MIDGHDQTILCVATSAGRVHDFALFKQSRVATAPHVKLLADTGYQGVNNQGVNKWHPNSQTPHKKSKCRPLTPEQKQQNHALASRRIRVEHVLRTLKRFRILSSTYRNRRKRFGLRLSLIAAIANLHK